MSHYDVCHLNKGFVFYRVFRLGPLSLKGFSGLSLIGFVEVPIIKVNNIYRTGCLGKDKGTHRVGNFWYHVQSHQGRVLQCPFHCKKVHVDYLSFYKNGKIRNQNY